MQTADDVATLLQGIGLSLADPLAAGDYRNLRDRNGNTVGRWQVEEGTAKVAPSRFSPPESPPVGLDVETSSGAPGRVVEWVEDPDGDGRDLWVVALADAEPPMVVEWADNCHVLPGQVD